MEKLKNAGVPEAELDAWYLLEYVTGIGRASYYADPDRKMPAEQKTKYDKCIEVCAAGGCLCSISPGNRNLWGFLFM